MKSVTRSEGYGKSKGRSKKKETKEVTTEGSSEFPIPYTYLQLGF